MIDYNWFFSTIAQCSAAIIGIMAAFLISKIIDEISRLDNLRNLFDELVINYVDLVANLDNRCFDWYNTKLMKHDALLGDLVQSGKFKCLSDDDIIKNIKEILPEIYCTDYNKCTIINTIKNYDTIDDYIREIPIQYKIQVSISYITEMTHSIEAERLKIEDLKCNCIKNIMRFTRLKQDSQTAIKRVAPIMTIVTFLIVGFVLSVAFPLSFLPVNNNNRITISSSSLAQYPFSWMSIFIVMITTLVEIMFVYMLIQLFTIRRQYHRILNSIDIKYLALSEYSNYFN